MATHLKHAHGLTTDEYVQDHSEFRKKHLKQSNDCIECLICNETVHSERALTYHLKREHGITKQEYAVEHVHNGSRPTCKCGCGQPTTFIHNPPYFREYVSGHNSRGESNPMHGRTHTPDTREKMQRAKYESLIKRLEERDLVAEFDFHEYNGNETHAPHTIYTFTCCRCNQSFEHRIRRSRIPTCPTCNATGSQFQRDVADFLESENVNFIENDRSVLDNAELDFYIPKHDFAIECDGIYWHSEIGGGKGRDYHVSKTRNCEAQGIQLMHVFEDEWKHNQDIVKSVFRAKLGLIDRILYARNTDIRQLNTNQEREFLESHHLMGYAPSTTAWGLFHDDTLELVCTFGHIRFSNQPGHELIRLCTRRNTIVVGGFSRLLNHHIKEMAPCRIISYADRRWSCKRTSAYPRVGFEHVKTSDPGYWYFTTHPLKRFHRSNFTKQTLVENHGADPNKSEFENMVEMGYDRIWDCGQLKFEWRSKKRGS